MYYVGELWLKDHQGSPGIKKDDLKKEVSAGKKY